MPALLLGTHYHRGMKRGKVVQVGATLGASLVLIAGIVVAIQRQDSTSPPKPTIRSLAPSPVAVTLSMSNGSNLTALGSSTPIQVQASGPGVDSVTIWEDDRAINTLRVPTSVSSRGIDHTTVWTAVTPGDHLLYASAHGRDGTAHSAPVAVRVMPATGTPARLTAFAPKGSTAATFAASRGIDLSAVRAVKSQPNATLLTRDMSAFEVDTTRVMTNYEVPKNASDPIVRKASRRVSAGSTLPALTSSTARITRPVNDISPPKFDSHDTLRVEVDGCSIEVMNNNPKGRASVYQSTRGAAGFVSVGSLAKQGSIELDKATPGLHAFVAGPPDKPTTSKPVSVTIPADCAEDLWKGTATLINGILTIPKATADPLTIYLSVDGQPAVRIPDDGFRLLTAPTRSIDISPYLPALFGSTIHLEVWSLDKNGHNAHKIGTGDAELPDGMEPADLIGESSAVRLSINPTNAKVVDKTIVGSWQTLSTRPDRVLWQVLAQPLDINNVSLAPSGLVASGVSPATGKADNETGSAGSFTIPISSLVLPSPTPIASKPMSFAQLHDPAATSNLPTGVKPFISNKMAIDPSELVENLTSDAQLTQGVGDPRPVISGTTYFIRVIPFDQTAPLGVASESARFDAPVAQDPPQIPLALVKGSFDPGRAANPALTGCIRVTSLPWKGYDSNQFYSAFFPSTGTYCNGDWQRSNSGDDCWGPDVLCEAWDVVVAGATWLVDTATKIWDAIAYVYNTIVDVVVDLAAKLNPYCISAAIAAKASGEIGFSKDVTSTAQGAAELCDKVAHVVAKAAMSAVLASFGLPPELPTSEQLKAMAKGNLTELAVAYLQDLGIPCDDLVIDKNTAGIVSKGVEAAGGSVPPGAANGVDVCRDAVGLVLDKVEIELKGAIQSNIAASSGLPLPSQPIKGFEFEMEPRGTFGPPSLSLTGTPTSKDAPSNGVCRVLADADVGLKAFSDPNVFKAFSQAKFNMSPALFAPTTWTGSTVLSINPSSGYTPSSQMLFGGAPMKMRVSSDCLGNGNDLFFSGTIRPPMGRWAPGQSD